MLHNARKTTSVITLMLFLYIALVSLPQIEVVKAQSTIYIRADGNVEGTDKIQRNGNTYTFTDDINATIDVKKSDIVIDGQGYTLQKVGSSVFGINVNFVVNVTIKNVQVAGFSYGIEVDDCSHCTISNNNITKSGSYSIRLKDSNYNNLSGNMITNNEFGIDLYTNSKNNIISGNTIENNKVYGILIRSHSQENSVYENIIKNNTNGIWVSQAQYNHFSKNSIVDNRRNGIEFLNDPCNNNTLSENTITGNNYCGIYISVHSQNISGNNITGNNYGIALKATDNILRNNRLYDNKYNFDALLGGVNDVDTSNTVEGKPIYYWVSEQDKTVPSDAGYVGLVNCAQITVENLALSKNEHSILLVRTINSTITGNTLSESNVGIQLYKSSNNTITGNTCLDNNKGVAIDESSTRNVISDNNFDNCGISVSDSSQNQIYENTVTGKCHGIVLTRSSNNALTNNNLTNTIVGITLHVSKNNRLKNNRMENNEWNFKVEGKPYANKVYYSNTVNGKPIYYLVNKKDKVVPSDAGYVALVNCKNITVQNCTLVDNQQGVLIAYTVNSTIANNNITSNTLGIQLYESSGINITGNSITNNCYGIELGIDSQHCKILDNYIAFNEQGVYFASAGNSTIYGNSFMNNTQQITAHFYAKDVYQNDWDNGSAGNYWSNYNGTDNNGDGIGDPPHIINKNNQDNYPLMDSPPIPTSPTTDSSEPTASESSSSNFTLPAEAIYAIFAAIAVILAAVAVWKLRKR